MAAFEEEIAKYRGIGPFRVGRISELAGGPTAGGADIDHSAMKALAEAEYSRVHRDAEPACGPILAQSMRQQAILDNLNAGMDRLEEQLHVILRPAPNEKDGETAVDPALTAPLEDRLLIANHRLELLYIRLDRLRERIAL